MSDSFWVQFFTFATGALVLIGQFVTAYLAKRASAHAAEAVARSVEAAEASKKAEVAADHNNLKIAELNTRLVEQGVVAAKVAEKTELKETINTAVRDAVINGKHTPLPEASSTPVPVEIASGAGISDPLKTSEQHLNITVKDGTVDKVEPGKT